MGLETERLPCDDALFRVRDAMGLTELLRQKHEWVSACL